MDNQEIKQDTGKLRLSLVPTEVITAIATIREYGIAKYGDCESWKDVYGQRFIDAAYRHWIEVVKNPIGLDPESGLPHLWHCVTDISFLCSKYEHIFKEGGYTIGPRPESETKPN